MNRILALMVLTLAASTLTAAQVSVDCNAGQSLNQALSKLDKQKSITVSVNGTCTEYVQVTGFDGLRLQALPGAALVQPAGGAGTLLNAVLLIESSRSVTVDGFSIQADTTTVDAIGIGHGSSDIRLRNLTVQGGTEGIIVFEASQVSIAYVTAEDPGYTPLGVYDLSDVHLERSVLANTTGALWHAGIDVGASHVTMYATKILNMQVGINVYDGGIVDAEVYNTYFPLGGPTDVVIQNPALTNYNGVSLGNGASMNLGNAKLQIINAGQTYGANTGGVLVSGGSSLSAGANLVVSRSQGQGVFVSNSSHADLDGSSITGSLHGGLVVVNQSSAAVGSAHPPTVISGNTIDLFCDSMSLTTGGVNIGSATSVQCTNLLQGDTVSIP
jgi:hypothetical protein